MGSSADTVRLQHLLIVKVLRLLCLDSCMSLLLSEAIVVPWEWCLVLWTILCIVTALRRSSATWRGRIIGDLGVVCCDLIAPANQ